MIKIAITGGHLTPAQAVIAEIKKRYGADAALFYFGRKYTFEGSTIEATEYKVLPKLVDRYFCLTAGRLQRELSVHTLWSLLKLPIGFIQAFFYLLSAKPQVIVSFGGYVSTPVVVAGWLLGIPILTHEQTVVSGLANKINRFFAKKICLTWQESTPHFPAKKVTVTGLPLRKEIFQSRETEKGELGTFLRLKQTTLSAQMIYITGGNQGSQTINETIAEVLPTLLSHYFVLHQCGERDYKMIEDRKWKMEDGKGKRENDLLQHYFVTPWVDASDIGLVYAEADVVISRSGANTVYEWAALGKPAICIPLPFAAYDEQQKNAEILERIGLVKILPQHELTGDNLLATIDSMMKNLENYTKAGQESKKLVDFHAAENIVDEMIALIA